MPASKVHPLLSSLAQRKFFVLLVLSILYPLGLIVMPESALLPVPLDLAAMSATVAILLATGHCRRLANAAAVLTVLTLLANVLAALSITVALSVPFAMVRALLLLAFFAVTIAVVLVSVLDRQRVSMEKVLGGISVYLMMGSLWGFLYVLLVLAQPAAFHGAQFLVPTGPEGAFSWFDLELAEFTYFSYVTLSTLGYGDITPTSIPAQMLVWMEALAGQVYLAVLIARLVSLQIVHSRLEETAPGNSGSAAPAVAAPSRAPRRRRGVRPRKRRGTVAAGAVVRPRQ